MSKHWRQAALVVSVYAGLLAIWPLVRPLYRPCFQAVGGFLLGVVDPFEDVRVLLEPRSTGTVEDQDERRVEHDTPHMDTLVLLVHRRLSGKPSLTGASSFFHGYHPTAVCIALFAGGLSSRAGRRRLLWGLLALHAFIALRLLIGVTYAYGLSTVGGRPALDLSPFLSRCLFWARHFAMVEPLTTYVVPLAIWALLASRGRELTSAATPAVASP